LPPRRFRGKIEAMPCPLSSRVIFPLSALLLALPLASAHAGPQSDWEVSDRHVVYGEPVERDGQTYVSRQFCWKKRLILFLGAKDDYCDPETTVLLSDAQAEQAAQAVQDAEKVAGEQAMVYRADREKFNAGTPGTSNAAALKTSLGGVDRVR
jgi:hypothetical protein